MKNTAEVKQPNRNSLIRIIIAFTVIMVFLAAIGFSAGELGAVKIFDIFIKVVEVTRGGVIAIFGIILAFFIYREYQHWGRAQNGKD